MPNGMTDSCAAEPYQHPAGQCHKDCPLPTPAFHTQKQPSVAVHTSIQDTKVGASLEVKASGLYSELHGQLWLCGEIITQKPGGQGQSLGLHCTA